jgi:hypothetical protein
LKKSLLVLLVVVFSACNFSCGGSSTVLLDRVVVSQGVTTSTSFGALIIVNGFDDTVPRVAPLSAGTSPGMMARSPSWNLLAAFDSASNTVFAFNTATEKAVGQVHLPCPTTVTEPCLGPNSSFILPTSEPTGYAAIPSATVNGFTFVGGVAEMSFAANSVAVTIAVPAAQTVVANSSGTQLLVFSNDSNSVTVLSPGNALPPVDQSCLSATPNAVCTIVTGFDRPVYAVVNGNTAYVLNCGPQCGGTQASIAFLDLPTLTITKTVPVEAATWALLNGSTLYVVGTPPTNNACTGETTAATTCGRLDIVDIGSGTVTTSGIVITDGYHDRMDLNQIGQLFIGSRNCTNIGDVNAPSGEVRGCLSIYNLGTGGVYIPPDNGNVDGLQGFITRPIEYVAEGGNARVYYVLTDQLFLDYINPNGTLPIVGYVGDVKSLDVF